jgi:hypothetical protein
MAQSIKKLMLNLDSFLEKSQDQLKDGVVMPLSFMHLLKEVADGNQENITTFIQLYFYINKKQAKKMSYFFFEALKKKPELIYELDNLKYYFEVEENNKILLILAECFNAKGTLALYMYYTMYKKLLSTSIL